MKTQIVKKLEAYSTRELLELHSALTALISLSADAFAKKLDAGESEDYGFSRALADHVKTVAFFNLDIVYELTRRAGDYDEQGESES